MNFRQNKKRGSERKSERFTDPIKSPEPKSLFLNSVRGALVSLAACIILLLLSSVAVYSTADPNRYVAPTAVCVLLISALFGGFAAARMNGRSALLCGSATALIFLTILFLLSFTVSGSFSLGYSASLAFGIRGIAIGISILGAFIGSKPKKQKHKRR